MHHAGDIVAPRGLQDVQRAFDIGSHVAPRRFVGVGDRDQRREVQNDLLPLDGPIHEVAVFDIAADDLNCTAHGLVKEGEVADQRARIVSDHGGDRRRPPSTSASTRWLPMKPPAPVTTILLPVNMSDLSNPVQ